MFYLCRVAAAISRSEAASDASPRCCGSLNARHRPFAKIGVQRIGDRLSIMTLIL